MNTTELKKQIEGFLQEGEALFIPQLSIDCVIFSFHDGHLKVLLLKYFQNEVSLTLPSGFVLQEEDLDTAALRNLEERTGLSELFLRQFHTFGKVSRYFPNHLSRFIEHLGIERDKATWFLKRFVTVGYYALVHYEQVKLQPGLFTQGYVWADTENLPPIAMDHAEIIQKALKRLRKDLQTQPVGINLLPKTFTIPELQSLYETILGRKIDRGNFRKKMLHSNILERLGKKKNGGAHRSPYLYRFDKEQYEASLREGIKVGF